MFCPECGKENKAKKGNCAYCGAELVSNARFRNTAFAISGISFTQVKDKVKKIGKVPKIIILSVSCVLVLVAILLSIGSALNSPKRIAEKYFEAAIAQDWETVYDYLAIDQENPLLSKEHFIKSMQDSDYLNSAIENYTVEKASYEDYGTSQRKYRLKYVGMEGSDQTDAITLIQQNEQSFLFYHKYLVSPDQFVSSCVMDIPLGASASIEGVAMQHVESSGSSSSYQQVSIGQVFAGEYDVTITTPITEDYHQKVSVSSGKYQETNGTSYKDWDEVEIESLKIKPAARENAVKLARDFINALYTNASTGKNLDKFASFGVNEQVCTNMMNKIYKEESGGRKNITITSFKLKDEDSELDTLYEDGTYIPVFEAEFKINYNCTWVHVNTWFDEVSEEARTNQKDSADITFTYDTDGNWKILSISGLSGYGY